MKKNTNTVESNLLKSGDFVINPDVSKNSPNYIGEVKEIKQLDGKPFAQVQFRDYLQGFACDILEKENPNVVSGNSVEVGDWKYSPHYKDHSEGHIFSEKEGRLIGNIVGAAGTSQERLNQYGNLITEAVNNYTKLKEVAKEQNRALHTILSNFKANKNFGTLFNQQELDSGINILEAAIEKAKDIL
jgi:hypothetical protein